MEAPEPTNQRNWIKPVLVVISQSIAFVTLAAQEWLPSLIDQPMTPPFRYNAAFRDEFPRAARLIVFTIVLSAIIVESLSLVLQHAATLTVIRIALKILVISLITAISFQPFAYVFGVRIAPTPSIPKRALSLRQILFTVLYTGVPWIPIFSFLRVTIPVLKGSFLVFGLIVFWVCGMYMIRNFARAIMVLTKCSAVRVWLSVVVPLVGLSAFILFR
jgi:hypothetical protein